MSLTNLALGTNLTQPFQDRSWIPPYRREKKQNGQFPRWRRDPWAAEGVSARDRDVCAPTLCYFFSEKLLKYFPEMQNILEAKDSSGGKADI